MLEAGQVRDDRLCHRSNLFTAGHGTHPLDPSGRGEPKPGPMDPNIYLSINKYIDNIFLIYYGKKSKGIFYRLLFILRSLDN